MVDAAPLELLDRRYKARTLSCVVSFPQSVSPNCGESALMDPSSRHRPCPTVALQWLMTLVNVAQLGPKLALVAPDGTGQPRCRMPTHGLEEDDVKQSNRKPFVVPTVKELASLSSVTLVSGGGGGTPT
jgi:hypothetical protein